MGGRKNREDPTTRTRGQQPEKENKSNRTGRNGSTECAEGGSPSVSATDGHHHTDRSWGSGRDNTGHSGGGERIVVSEGGYVGEVVEAIGGTRRTPHMDGDRIRIYFGRRRQVEGAE